MNKVDDREHQNLFERIRAILTIAKQQIVQTVKQTKFYSDFEIGRAIVEVQQQGDERANYGKSVLKGVSTNLTDHFGKGFSVATGQNSDCSNSDTSS